MGDVTPISAAKRFKPRLNPCPDCGRPARTCWVMPCAHLSFRLECGADSVNDWCEKVGAPFRVEAKS